MNKDKLRQILYGEASLKVPPKKWLGSWCHLSGDTTVDAGQVVRIVRTAWDAPPGEAMLCGPGSLLLVRAGSADDESVWAWESESLCPTCGKTGTHDEDCDEPISADFPEL
jgi:hypothetical protein